MNIGKHRRTDPITPIAVIVVGIGAALWLWPPSNVLTQIGPTLSAPPAVSITHRLNTTAAGAPVVPTAQPPTTALVTTAQAQPEPPARSADLSSAAPATAAAATPAPAPPSTSPATTAILATSPPIPLATTAAAPTTLPPFQPAAVPASIWMPFASTHHPDGVQMTVLPHGPTSNGDLWIPGPEEGIDNWANDVSWLNTPGFAAPFSSHGAIIIAGHINWGGTSGALADLSEYATADIGKQITLTMTDGRTRTYRITTGFAVAKDQLAAETNQGPLHTAMFGQTQTYGQPGHPSEELRLISCGGQYDPATRNYTSNIILTAQPVT